MNLRRIKHTLLRLSLEEKVVGIGALMTMIGCFLPWYTEDNAGTDVVTTEYGFSGDLGVIGFVIFLMALLGFIGMIAENMRIPFPKFGHKRENILFFFLGQTAFLSLLTLAIYTKRSLEFTNANLRFGIYLVIGAAFFSALSAFALIRKNRRQEALEFFEQQPPLAEGEDADEMAEEDIEELKEEVTEEMPEEASTFQEDVALMDEIEKEQKNEFNSNEEGEEVLKEIAEDPKKEEEKPIPNQSNFFTKEAGVGDKKKEEEKPSSRLSMGFYEDK